MSSLSENKNSIITTSYQSKLAISAVANMTTSPTTLSKNTNVSSIDTKNVNEIWKSNFNNNASNKRRLLDLDNAKISWANLNNNNNQAVVTQFILKNDTNNDDNIGKDNKEVKDFMEAKDVKNGDDESDNSISNTSINGKVEVEKYSNDDGNDTMDAIVSPSHHARRPMNAFLIFCKKHRPIVRKKFPALENRGVTRILGEWWSLLDSKDKDPYTKLAKQYKDAFFTANPDFKWYKLPAPPLRTLPTRPTKSDQACSPPVSPINMPLNICATMNSVLAAQTAHNTTLASTADFTPGKLADESQLGMLSSLLTGNSYTKTPPESETNNNTMNLNLRNDNDNDLTSNSQHAQSTNETPSRPLKKRLVPEVETSHKADINNKIVRNLFEEQDKKMEEDGFSEDNNEANMNGRKSYRKGKGNRYADIMANGKLIKNKRGSTEKIQIENVGSVPNKLELNTTIKKLQERLNNNGTSNSTAPLTCDTVDKTDNLNTSITTTATAAVVTATTTCTTNNTQPVVLETRDERTRTISEVSEMSDVADYSKAIPSFDLDSRIADLPHLSYDSYVQRKKDAKKRKLPKGAGAGTAVGATATRLQQKQPKMQESKKRCYDIVKDIGGIDTLNKNDLINSKINSEKQTGSKKRKNKHNITHLENNSLIHTYENDLSGLNTLAEIASNLSTNTNQNNNNSNHNNNKV